MGMKMRLEKRVVIDLKYSVWCLHGEPRAKLEKLPEYVRIALEKAGQGDHTVVLTGGAPVWLYLAVAHALHGRVGKLVYNSPTTGDIIVFDHRKKKRGD